MTATSQSLVSLEEMAAEGLKPQEYEEDVRCQIMNIYQLLQAKREDILQTATKYGAYNIRIFGSVARKEADVNSDVDFLVEMEPGRSLFDLGGLLMELQDLLGCDVDVVTEKGLRDRIRERVLNEAVTL